jgi:hypothetical protein
MSNLTDEKKNIQPYVKHGNVLLKASHTEAFPANVNELESWRRIPSKSSLKTSSVITSSDTVEFEIEGDNGGYPHETICELVLKETGNSTAATVITPLIFDKIEYFVNGSKVSYHVQYPDETGYLNYLNMPYEEIRKIRGANNLNLNYTPVASNLPQNGQTTFYIRLNMFKGSQPDFRNINGGIKIKFYFNSPLVFADNTLSTTIGLFDMNIILRQLNIEKVHHSLPIRHKYINYTRCSDQFTMSASNKYKLKLTSLIGHCSHIVLMIRANPVSTSYINWSTLIGNIDRIEFNDRSGKPVGIPFTQKLNNYIMADSLNTDFIVSYPTGTNMWILPFSILPSAAENGVFYGSYRLSGDESIDVYPNSSFVSGSYEIMAWGAQMNYFDVNPNGEFTFTK